MTSEAFIKPDISCYGGGSVGTELASRSQGREGVDRCCQDERGKLREYRQKGYDQELHVDGDRCR